MRISFTDDLSTLHIIAENEDIALFFGRDKADLFQEEIVTSFDNPILRTDRHRISNLAPSLRDTIFRMLAYPITTEFMGTSVKVDRTKNKTVCDANIDTVFLCKAIASSDVLTKNNIKAIEIGCGSGFVSKFLLEHFEQIDSLTAVDISKESIECARENIDDERINFIYDDAHNFLSKEEYFDLIVCNPPYVPTHNSFGNISYEGTSLFENLIENGHKLLSKNGKMIINLSSVAKPFVDNAIEKSKMKITKIAQMSVPFKILTTLNDESKMNYLLSNGLLEYKHSQGYEYWHDIYVLACEPINLNQKGA